MNSQDRTTLFAGPEAAAGLEAPRDQLDSLLERSGYPGVGGMTGIVEEGIERLERVIQQYPWPTVLFGIGLGFLLARRMR